MADNENTTRATELPSEAGKRYQMNCVPKFDIAGRERTGNCAGEVPALTVSMSPHQVNKLGMHAPSMY
jgi:hypothetical protein